MVASLSQFTYRRCFLQWGIPDHLVYPGSFLPLIFRHSSDSKSFATKRVGQKMLQRFHFSPFSFLCCLHDASLEPTHVLGGLIPIGFMPVFLFVENRTNVSFFGCSNRLLSRRHLLCLLCRFARRSRDERPEGSGPAFASDTVSIRISSITEERSLVPSSYAHCSIGTPYGVRSPERESNGFPTFHIRILMG